MLTTNYYRHYQNIMSRMNNYSNSYNKNYSMFGISNNFNKNNYQNSLKNLMSQQVKTYSENLEKFKKYKEDSEKFTSQFESKLSELKNSSKKLKAYSEDSVFLNNNGDEKSQNRVIEAVKDFADDYNNTLKFLDENSSVSDKVSDLSNSYKTIRYNSAELDEIGINVDSKTGFLSVNEKKLSSAVKNNLKNVRKVLGTSSDGIANKIYNKTTVAMIDSKDYYPTAQLDNNYINKTYFYNSANSSIIQSNMAYSSGILFNYLV